MGGPRRGEPGRFFLGLGRRFSANGSFLGLRLWLWFGFDDLGLWLRLGLRLNDFGFRLRFHVDEHFRRFRRRDRGAHSHVDKVEAEERGYMETHTKDDRDDEKQGSPIMSNVRRRLSSRLSLARVQTRQSLSRSSAATLIANFVTSNCRRISMIRTTRA